MTTLITGIGGLIVLWLLFGERRCPVCRGRHYREPGERHEPGCYMVSPRRRG